MNNRFKDNYKCIKRLRTNLVSNKALCELLLIYFEVEKNSLALSFKVLLVINNYKSKN
jgi:hypothetical protein